MNTGTGASNVTPVEMHAPYVTAESVNWKKSSMKIQETPLRILSPSRELDCHMYVTVALTVVSAKMCAPWKFQWLVSSIECRKNTGIKLDT